MTSELLLALPITLFLLLFPGLWFTRRDEREKEDLLELLTTSCVCSAAFWAVAVWFVPLGLLREVGAVVVLVGGSSFALVRARGFPSAGWRGRKGTAVLLLALLLCSAVRVGVVAWRRPPSAGDLTMHAYMTELLVIHDGLPGSHEPLLPISSFGQNSPGLHTIAALVRTWSGLSSHAAPLLVGVLALVLLSLSIDRFIRVVWPAAPRSPRALAALAVVLLARQPQMFLTWGGVPTLLSLALVVYFLAEWWALLRRPDLPRAARAGMIAAGAALTHLIPTLVAVYLVGGLSILKLAKSRSLTTVRAALVNGTVVASLALLLTWKFLGLRSLTTDSATVEWARDWIRLDMTRSYSILERVAAPRSLPPDFLYYAGLPIQIAVFLGALTAGTLAVWIALRLRRQTDSVQVSLVIIGVLAVLYTASIGEFLPYWMGLYPGRVLAFMLLPAAFALTEAFVFLASRRRLTISAAALSMAFLGVAWGRMGPNGDANLGAIGFDGLIRTYTESVNARVTEDDLAVMKWITENLAADAVIANNQGDGGHLIPAVCHRKILAPHYQAFWYREEMARWAASTHPGYLFIGAAPSPAFGRDYEAAELDGRSDLEVLFQRGDARLYRWREGPVDGQPRGRPATSPLSPPR